MFFREVGSGSSGYLGFFIDYSVLDVLQITRDSTDVWNVRFKLKGQDYEEFKVGNRVANSIGDYLYGQNSSG